MIPSHVQRAYKLKGPSRLLEGGTRDVYRVSDRIVKQMVSTSFENPHLLPSIQDISRRLHSQVLQVLGVQLPPLWMARQSLL